MNAVDAPATAAGRSLTLGWIVASACAVALMAWHAVATYWQCDDAYISFRYVWQFVAGNGLVFNPGERVEGYTNFAWVLELAFLSKVFGAPPEIASNVLSVLCTIGALWCVARFALNGPVIERRAFALFAAFALLATSRTWAVWTTSGLETRQFTFFVLLGALLVHKGLGRPRRLLLASLAFAAAEFTRPEGLLMWGCGGLWLLIEMACVRRFSWRGVLAYGVPFVAIVGAHFLWRRVYYDDWLPNTYYAKHVRPWPEAGWRYYGAAWIETGAWLLTPLALVGGVARMLRGDRTFLLVVISLGLHVAYLVRIGGDHFELRPLDFYWPLLAVFAGEGMYALAAGVARRVSALRRRTVELLVACVVLTIGVVYGASVQLAKAAYTQAFDTRAKSHFLMVDLQRENAPLLYRLPLMPTLLGRYNEWLAYTLPRGVGTVWREHEVFWRDEMRNWSRYGASRGTKPLPADAVTARGSIGVSAYYLGDLTVIDQKGLTDRHVARQESTRPNDKRYMAHDRFIDMKYLYGRGYNLLIEPSQSTRRDALLAAPYALRLADDLWMPITTEKPEWIDRAFVGRPLWRWRVDERVGCFVVGDAGAWTTEGAAFEAGARADLPLKHALQWPLRCDGPRAGLISRDERGSGERVGTARSPFFTPGAEALLEVRLAGDGGGVGLRVRDARGDVLVELLPRKPAQMIPEHVDLSPWAGRELQLELYDESDVGWIGAEAIVVLSPEALPAQ